MLGRELAAAGLVIVSGLARGIDGEAHRRLCTNAQLHTKEERMYRSILVPLDGSSFGEHALPYALVSHVGRRRSSIWPMSTLLPAYRRSTPPQMWSCAPASRPIWTG